VKPLLRTLRQDMAHALGWPLLLAMLSIPALILLDNGVDIEPMLRDRNQGSVYYFFFASITAGGLYGVYLAPVFCAGPYAWAFCREWATGLTPYSVFRTGRGRYAGSKFAVACLSGGMALCLGYLLLFLSLSLIWPLISQDRLEHMLDGNVFLYEGFFVQGRGWLYFAAALHLGFWEGAFYGGTAALVSTCVSSIYAVLISPFILHFALGYSAKLLRIPDRYRLDMWYAMRSAVGSEELTILLCAVVTLLYLLGIGLIYAARIKGRIAHG
jgi:hypothetical protein